MDGIQISKDVSLVVLCEFDDLTKCFFGYIIYELTALALCWLFSRLAGYLNHQCLLSSFHCVSNNEGVISCSYLCLLNSNMYRCDDKG